MDYEPERRESHSAVSVDGKVLMWGGGKDGRVVESFMSGQWGSRATTGTAPLAANKSGSVVLNGTPYNFGGYGGSRVSNDLHELTSNLMEWVEVKYNNTAEEPRPRFACGMILRGTEELVVVGGTLGDYRSTNEVISISIREGEYT